MNYRQGVFTLAKCEQIAETTYSFVITCPEIVSLARAGQFAHLRVPGFSLRRPISICEVLPKEGTIRVVFDIRGEGTKVLATLKAGDSIDMMAPIGNGFTLLEPDKKVIVIGGGIGVPPLLEVAKHYGSNSRAVLGFRSKSAVILQNDFASVGCGVHLCTDDGSVGRKGFVTALLKEQLDAKKPDILYACGPKPMLKAVANLAKEYGVRCQHSLEERMACGVGACLGCACKTKKDGKETYSHVCKNGPVFEAEEVVFDE